ncbi:hypothetical protein EMIHUDRAFT_246553 [Emiliania huxleyi CCMP1516]|uniref:FYVE-type domain-containing protein n=2 Tax=Emiliania huxleyi TaxID=2903 RepID=A0A0D3IRS4_EMIH1|nr:hypothetical protein EMIHUDRAFT_246553 [Emiliania huxleyi CCMP1516]EOD13959.1 hypothetical protein EMIHUDRAFT_246553 [Emiliania huxleyi CCMP1516]|eukprot:XP_005766388.1 hypothetical protein EMIHUDRAFT_246553 [Emiliania huxleyi CCMP1516]
MGHNLFLALHLLAERAVYSRQEAAGVGALGAAEGGGAESPPPFPTARLLEMLGEAGVPLPLDAQEAESGNTAMHTAAFGGCVEMAISLVGLGASVGLPNRDGFTPLDSMQPSGACQLCKLPFMLAQPQTGGGSLSQQLMARTNYASTNNLRKHHCRHCGRVICASCSPRRCERVCLQCEKLLLGSDSARPSS